MRILFLSHCYPYPPNKGDRVRAFHEIRHLAGSHEVHLLALSRESQTPGDLEALQEICKRVEVYQIDRFSGAARSLVGLLGSRPLTLSYFHSAPLKRRIEEMLSEERFDLAMAYSSSMGPYLEQIPGIPRVIDFVDVDSQKWQQYAQFARWPKTWVYSMESSRLRAYEKTLAAKVSQIAVTSSRERDLIRDQSPGVKCSVVRNGVDFDFFKPDHGRSREPMTLVFTGQMDYFPNIDGVCWFVEAVFPGLRRQFPDLRLRIVGRSPTVEIERLAEVPGVEVTGEVPDVRPYLSSSTVFVAPLRIAQGVQNKVLEAVAMGLPVVCSDRVHDGLKDSRLLDGEDLLVRNDRQGYAEAIAKMLASREARDRLAASSLEKVLEYHQWSRNMAQLEALMTDLLTDGHAADGK